MILDSSAIVAILFREPGFETLLDKLERSAIAAVGVPTLTEAAIVVSARLRRDARSLLARFLAQGAITALPFGEEHYGTAVDAWLRFGKGRHKASLNFGDCMAYAIAKVADQPLLCTGDEFSHTDVKLG